MRPMCNTVERGVNSACLPSNPVGPFLNGRPQPVVGLVQSTTRLVPACLPAALLSKPMNGMKTIFYELRPAFPARRLRLPPEAAAAARSFRSWLMRSMEPRKATRRVHARSAFSGIGASPKSTPSQYALTARVDVGNKILIVVCAQPLLSRARRIRTCVSPRGIA